MHKKNVTFKFRIADEERDAFLSACEKDGLSASEVTRKLVRDYTVQPRRWVETHWLKRGLSMLKKPITAFAMLGGISIAGLVGPLGTGKVFAEELQMHLTIEIESASSRHELITVLNVRPNNEAWFNLVSSQSEDGPEYSAGVTVVRCNQDGGMDCGAGNLFVAFNIMDHSGPEIVTIADPTMIILEDGGGSRQLLGEDEQSIEINIASNPL